ncbi:phospholipase D family protein [Undibacterium terreum]|uniref:Phospholipase D family protein n=1 Tax=Undibacterium terreum TaxID=1224302 RepID=A0A916UY33_9BURK|nr:phospholipase D family protein [Undibacterium terreum]GGC93982.1 phospholipase D family protein [Undibacterium terreum]
MHTVLRLMLLLAILSLGGCAALPPRPPVPSSFAIPDFNSTPLAAATAAALPADGRSGFRLMPVASVSFATRIRLAQQAKQTLDVQYYVFQHDDTGLALLKALRDAARRGVRVRILIDDLYAAGQDTVWSQLAALPNMEVRLFNPFPAARSSFLLRFVAAASDFDRVNHRMHNKLFIADNVAAVFGGRNIADEYFMRAGASNFVDIDAFAAGPVVRQLSGLFDTYWNSPQVYPLADISGQRPDPQAADAALETLLAPAAGPPYDHLPPELAAYGTLPQELADGHVQQLTAAHAEAYADPPAKVSGLSAEQAKTTVTQRVLVMLNSARQQALIVSPYFIPGDSGVAMMRQAKEHDVQIILTTNSLGSTDEPLAQYGYLHYRKEMLKAGVEIHELSPTLSRVRRRLGPFGSSQGSLHAKTAVVDNKKVYMGSMNLDARSASKNTEIGVFIDSPELCAQIEGLMDRGSLYRLRLAANGEDIEWLVRNEDGEVVHTEEPEVNWWRRLKIQLLGPLVPEGEL